MSSDATVSAFAPPPPPAAVPLSKSAPSSSARPALRRAVSMRHEARSAKTLWVPRVRDVQLDLTLDALVVADEATGGKRETIPWQDVLGAHLLNDENQYLSVPVDLAAVATSKTYVFAVFAYPPKRPVRERKLKKRQLREWLFRFPGSDMDDVVPLLTWVNYLADPRSDAAMRRASSLEELTPVERTNRKFYVIINPVGGAGKAVPTFEAKIAPLFKYAHIDVEVKLTERASHGVEIAETLPLGVYDCVVTVGGDGSLCEIFQGLMKRVDWKDAIRQPLGVIPGGSGNGLFSSLMHELGEQFKPGSAGFVLAKGLPHPLDLTSVRNPHGESMYSFLSTEWAFIADVDVESEKLRALGGARFTVKTVQNLIFSKKEYQGEVWYLEEDPSSETPLVQHNAGEGAERPGFDLFANLEDGAVVSDGSQAKWKRLQGSFLLVWAMNVTHAASDALIAPGAVLNDGFNYLVIIDETRPRKDLIAAFLGIDNGTHVEVEGVQLIKTRAFKIAPSRPDDLICVDGEVFKGPIEAQVHHNVARMITLPRATSCHTHGA